MAITEEMQKKDEEFLRDFSPAIYWNDAGCYHWAFDARLPSGRYVTDIRFDKNLKMRYRILPSREEREEQELEERKKREEFWEKKKEEEWERETGKLIAACLKGLHALDDAYSLYFPERIMHGRR